jgi:glucoamylase
VSCDDVAPFSGEEIKKIVGYFMNNIDINGGGQVAAATSKQFPNYWYHWARDSALSLYQMMNALPQSEYDIHMKHYVNWAFNRLQNLSCNAGVDVRGEPKFNLDGTCFTDGWMRPQNDAAGLRSITMVRYAYVLLSSGQKDFVTSSMYRTDESQNGIKKDLAYAQQIWNQPSGDPWEEVRGQILFEKLASRRGLLEGAKLADTLGDSAASAQYRKVAAEIAQDILTNHWNGEKGIFMELPNTRELDSATHLGLIYGDFEDGFLDATNEKVQSSISVLIDSFSNNYFQINTKDDEAKIPGILVGRYLNDVYNGGNPQQPKDGNPWILCSASLAEMFYRAARSYGASGTIEITETNANFWKNVRQLSTYASSMGIDVTLTPGTVYTASRDTVKFRSILNALITSGDGILNRIRYHVEGVDFHMAEEINKDNGAPQGAENLTWSYGTVIGAMEARKGALKAYQSLTGSATA